MRVVLSGSHGLVGSQMVEALRAAGHDVSRLVRDSSQAGPADVVWNPKQEQVDAAGLEGADAVIHLAGESIVGRWTEEKKRAIRESRVKGTKTLSHALASLENKPAVLLCASAIGYYGDRGDQELTESASPGDMFLSRVCVEWEEAALPAAEAGIRVVNMRFGIILSKDGGALKTMLTPFKLGMGGRIGDGKQFLSWIFLPDAVRAILFLLENDAAAGPVNMTAPQPVRNQEFVKTLASVLNRPAALPVPAAAARAAAGDMADELLLASARVLPERLSSHGFSFQYPSLEGALRQELA